MKNCKIITAKTDYTVIINNCTSTVICNGTVFIDRQRGEPTHENPPKGEFKVDNREVVHKKKRLIETA